jgi:hypothetical protein
VNFEVRQSADDGADELDSLYFWLIAEPDLRGRVTLKPAPPGSGHPGFFTDSLEISISPDNAVGLLVSSLVSWMANRRGGADSTATSTDSTKSGSAANDSGDEGPRLPGERITLLVTRSDGASMELSAALLDGLTPAQLQARVDQLSEALITGGRQR